MLIPDPSLSRKIVTVGLAKSMFFMQLYQIFIWPPVYHVNLCPTNAYGTLEAEGCWNKRYLGPTCRKNRSHKVLWCAIRFSAAYA